jgi:hypothetical protein
VAALAMMSGHTLTGRWRRAAASGQAADTCPAMPPLYLAVLVFQREAPPGLGGRGRTCYNDLQQTPAPVAQRIERARPKCCVGGSIPSRGASDWHARHHRACFLCSGKKGTGHTTGVLLPCSRPAAGAPEVGRRGESALWNSTRRVILSRRRWPNSSSSQSWIWPYNERSSYASREPQGSGSGEGCRAAQGL